MSKATNQKKCEPVFLGAPIISIKEARKLLGVKYDSVPDKMVEQIIFDMIILSAKLIDWQNGSTKSEGVV